MSPKTSKRKRNPVEAAAAADKAGELLIPYDAGLETQLPVDDEDVPMQLDTQPEVPAPEDPEEETKADSAEQPADPTPVAVAPADPTTPADPVPEDPTPPADSAPTKPAEVPVPTSVVMPEDSSILQSPAAFVNTGNAQVAVTNVKTEDGEGGDDQFAYDEFDADELAGKTVKLREKMLYDMIDYHFEVILKLEHSERRNRPVHHRVAQDLMKIYPHNQQQFGRLYVRSLLCNLLMEVFPGGMDSTLPNLTDDLAWHTIKTDLENVRNQCIRKDSGASSAVDKPSPRVNEQRVVMALFSKRFDNMLTYLEISRIAQSVKVAGLFAHVLGDTEAGTVENDQALLDQSFNKIRDSTDERARKILFSLFQGDGQSTACHTLKPASEVREIVLSIKAFDLNWISTKFEKLILSWNTELYGMKKPKLFLLRYNLTAKLKSHATIPKKGKTSLRRQTTAAAVSATLDELASDRIALRDNHGEDPLEGSTALAAEAMGEGPSSKRIKAEESDTAQHEAAAAAAVVAAMEAEPTDTRTYELFDDSSEDEENEKPKPPVATANAATAGAPLFQLVEGGPTTTMSVADANNPFYTGPQPDPGVFDLKGNVLIKRPWTEEETEALMFGIRTFGAGKWVQIKNLYGEIFKNRSSVMLKDKYRNLRRQRKLPDDLFGNTGSSSVPV